MTRVVFREDVLEHGSNGESSQSAHRGSDISEDGAEIASVQEFNKQKMRRRQSVSAESKEIHFYLNTEMTFEISIKEIWFGLA
jgi:hypothetical protein